MNPTTRFDHLCKKAFQVLYPQGSAKNWFKAPPDADCYYRAVKPDYVMPDGRWIDFKFRVSYGEKEDVPWRPSSLYSSLRKYVDHVNNSRQDLVIVYKHIHGSIGEVDFPIKRGAKVLIEDIDDFNRKIKLVNVHRIYPKLNNTKYEWIISEIESI